MTRFRSLLLLVALTLLVAAAAGRAQTPMASRLDAAIKAAGVPIVGVSIGNDADKATWTVQPPHLQGAAQPTIDAFNAADPAHDAADLDAAVKRALDNERLSSAIVWTILKQMYPADTDAQTKTKFEVARTRIINAYKSQIWKQ